MKNWPIFSNGASTGFLPIHIKIQNLITINQKVVLANKLKLLLRIKGFKVNGKKYKIAIDMIRAKTPPNLLGIDRKIAYIGKKYHSG